MAVNLLELEDVRKAGNRQMPMKDLNFLVSIPCIYYTGTERILLDFNCTFLKINLYSDISACTDNASCAGFFYFALNAKGF